MTLQRYARVTAWLGLIAMWLVVCAPLVSQLVVAARAQEPVAVLCSALAPASTSASATQSTLLTHHEPMSGSLAACGYCDLLASHPAAPALPPVAVQILTLIVVMTVPVLSVRFTPLGAFPSGRPRAPPFAS